MHAPSHPVKVEAAHAWQTSASGLDHVRVQRHASPTTAKMVMVIEALPLDIGVLVAEDEGIRRRHTPEQI